MMNTEWKIARAETACATCGTAFRDGDSYVVGLYDSGAEYQRRDYCAACWQRLPAATPGGGEGGDRLFSFWRGVQRKKDDLPAHRRVDAQIALEVFQRSATSTDPRALQLRYILALMLMRKKVLRFEDARKEEGRDLLVLRSKDGETTYLCDDPHLDEAQIEALKEDVGKLLGQDIAN